MFVAPAHASYIALCRELRLERKWQDGDYVSVTEHGIFAYGIVVGSDQPTGNGDPVWLPRLDQWLTMLEEAGLDKVTTFRAREHFVAWAEGLFADSRPNCEGPTREEAAARLWRDVTGRETQSRM